MKTTQELKDFILLGVDTYKRGSISEKTFLDGINQLSRQYGAYTIDKILTELCLDKLIKEQKYKTSFDKDSFTYNYNNTNNFTYEQYQALRPYLLQYNDQTFTKFDPKLLDNKSKSDYNNKTSEEENSENETMQGIDYIRQSNLNERHYKHMRTMLQCLWDLNNVPAYNRYDIDSDYKYDPYRLSKCLQSFNPEDVNKAHYKALEKYKGKRGRPQGSRNKAQFKEGFEVIDELKDISETDTDFVTHTQLEAKEYTNVNQVAAVATKLENVIKSHINDVEARLQDQIKNIELQAPRVVEIKQFDLPKIELGIQHHCFSKLLKVCISQLRNGSRLAPWVYGPAGTGKSTAAEFVARALNLNFYTMGKTLAKFEILGFINTSGYQSTEFRKAYQEGGVFCADEMDAWSNEATVALNAALANGHCAFPDQTIPRHKDFVFIAAANTTGSGATIDYVGRNKQDNATLDRFVFVHWPLDEALENSIIANKEWLSYVRKVRDRVAASGINPKPLITPRASLYGEALLASGLDWMEVVDMTLRKGLSDQQWNLIKA